MSGKNLSPIYGACAAIGALTLGYFGGPKLYDQIDWQYMNSVVIPETVQVCDSRGLSLRMNFGLSVNLRDFNEDLDGTHIQNFKDSVVNQIIEPHFRKAMADNTYNVPQIDWSSAIEDGVVTAEEVSAGVEQLARDYEAYSKLFAQENLDLIIRQVEEQIEAERSVKIEISDINFYPNLVDPKTAAAQGHSFQTCEI